MINPRQGWKAFSVLEAADPESPALTGLCAQLGRERRESKNEQEIMSVWLKTAPMQRQCIVGNLTLYFPV